MHYASTTIYLDVHAIFAKFPWHHSPLFCPCHTTSEIVCYTYCAAQVTEQTFSNKKKSELNKKVLIVWNLFVFGFLYVPLNKKNLFIYVYAEQAFACNDDLSPQLEFIILLSGENDQCHILHKVPKI